MLKNTLLIFLVGVVAAVAGTILYLRSVDDYQTDGTLTLGILDNPVRVLRDEKGVPYIYAESLDDAVRAQGFINAQDRLYQIEFSKYLAQGRLSELIGPGGLRMDIQHRVVGLHRHAKKHASLLGADTRHYVELYLDGLNAYIEQQVDEHPFGFRLMGLTPEPWSIEDFMSLQYFLNWTSSENHRSELISLMIFDAVGSEKAAEISPIVINPDDESERQAQTSFRQWAKLDLQADETWLEVRDRTFQLGSNHWVMNGARSTNGAPVLANDPHIDSRTLPGIWYPLGIITPELRAVGIAGSASPGMAVTRTNNITYGVTNAYGDVVDLYIEQQDPDNPDHYLEGQNSIPFDVVEETIRILERGSKQGFREETIIVRLTRRGPVISDHGMALNDGRLISLRWSAPEFMSPDLGQMDLLRSKSAEEFQQAVSKINAPYNYVYADVDGNIGLKPAGRIPIRASGDGSFPHLVTDGSDNWIGLIPSEAMPQIFNPARGWAGDANHRYVPADYPYYYSSFASPSWRYRRIKELLDGDDKKSPEDHWSYIRDVKNLMAARIAPIMAEALLAHDDTKTLGDILKDWDFMDEADQVAPSIFQSTYRHFARRTYVDELGPELTDRMLGIYYFWHERLARLVTEGTSDWFDDSTTDLTESRDDLFHLAALDAREELTGLLGDDPNQWQWGKLHTLTFASPLIPGDFAARWLGGGTRPMDGSGETLNRGFFPFRSPYAARTIDSARLVIDLADPDKIMAVVSGGVSGRQFHPHLKNQLDDWFSGEPVYLWYSDEAIEEHAQSELHLVP